MAVFPPFTLVEKGVVKLEPLETAIRGDMKNNMRNETKIGSVRVMQFSVNSLFYT